jgi:pyruvate dehydrogenase E1 component beta subunit
VEELVKNGFDPEVIDLRSLRPLDTATIVKSIKKTNRCVIIDEDYGYCGIGDAIIGKLHKLCFDDLDAPIERLASDEIPVPFNHFQEEAMIPSVERVIEGVKEVMNR